MNTQLKRISIVVLAMFTALMVSTTLIQVFQADQLAADGRNTRTLYDSYGVERGPILAGDTVIAESVPSDDQYEFARSYPEGELYSPITGYFNQTQGSSGLEQSMNDYLSGTSNTQFLDSLNRIVTDQAPAGAAVETSIDPDVQQAASDALGDLQGAIVAVEPSSGRILAMTTSPGYDPNRLASHNSEDVIAAYDELINDPSQPLINRATGGNLNPPGSSFKVVVAAAAFDTGEYTPDSTLPNPVSLTLPGSSATVYNWTRTSCGSGDTVTIREAIRQSCNVPLAELGMRLGDDTIKAMAEKLGFNQAFDIPTETTASSYPNTNSDAETGLSSFGQMNVRTTPLQMALVSAAVAADGKVMSPTLVDRVTGSNLQALETTQPSEFSTAFSPEVADMLTEVMVNGVANGQSSNAKIEGVDVAGKTGTAQNGDDDPYTLWFTGFAPAENPEVAVAVVIENDANLGHHSSGNIVAAPIAKKVIEAVLNK
ncbi:peptidoglycan D,D-transpeptidase FtsI family protein [Mycetocola reblochoni]|uniref:Cell division protein FtsI [Peptidoglycan synthetase] n=2 Tax=Mycetocola reblochoni TaxID=331618 RepID=A0A1R4JFW0_9MICO|nr:penicillin-binding transpeptidase domain-containing protein [Mycetocola reblochoni]RLP67722.1 penicillin-binding protein 2 [Mycetocola reblochoni]SJN30906.1 Cell division protein FtsI [Peptidoglycan synthetase] [Mycetocola reblochoni REB411]